MAKEIYEIRENYARKRAIENAEIGIENGLAEEQTYMLDSICSIRHRMHTTDASRVYNVEASEYHQYTAYCDEINRLVSELNLNIEFRELDTTDFPDSYCDDVDGLSNDERIESIETVADYMEMFNKRIEKYLHEVDKHFGTSYEPTGATRIY